jgi:hypothetical protein
MRLSNEQGDPGYRPYRKLPRSVVPRVMLDGSEVSRCVTADSKRGFILRYVEDEFGRPVPNARRKAFKLERLYGTVTIDIVPLRVR